MNIMPACQNKKVEITDLPESSQNFIKQYFPLDSITSITSDSKNKKYKVEFFNRSEITFNTKGVWEEINVKQNPFPIALFDILPANLFQHLVTTYPKKPISAIQKTSYGYEVKIGFSPKTGNKIQFTGRRYKITNRETQIFCYKLLHKIPFYHIPNSCFTPSI